MLKITTIEVDGQCLLVLEGELTPPWVAELRKVWKDVHVSTRSLTLKVDLRDVITISREGEGVLFEMLRDGVQLVSDGIFNKYVLKQLAHKAQTRFAVQSPG